MGCLREIGDLVLELRDKYDLELCVETGTHLGDSTGMAATYFRRVITLDISSYYLELGKTACQNFSNITYLLGNTTSLLPAIVAGLTGPSLFWLDAHMVKDFTDVVDSCPLLNELDIINQSPLIHCVLIDDLNTFLPPQPHSNYPLLPEVHSHIDHSRYIMRLGRDTIALGPPDAVDILDKFAGRTLQYPFAVKQELVNEARAEMTLETFRKRLYPKIPWPTKLVCQGSAQ